MKVRQHSIIWTTAALLSLLLVQAVDARKNKNNQGTPPPGPPPPPNNADANDLANAPAANASDDAASKALIAMAAAQKKVESQFESSDDWKNTNLAFTKASENYHAAVAAASEILSSVPSYAAAITARDTAEAHLEALRSGSATPDKITAAAQAAMDARSAVTKMQADAVTNNADVVSAKAALAQATKDLADIQQKEKDAVAADPDWQAAKQQFDAAKSSSGSPGPTSAPSTDSSTASTSTPPAHHGKSAKTAAQTSNDN